MASSQKFRDYVVNQFSGEFSVTTRKMMGEYILYSQKKKFLAEFNSPIREQNQWYIFLKKKYRIQIS